MTATSESATGDPVPDATEILAELGLVLPDDRMSARRHLVEFSAKTKRYEAHATWQRLQAVYILLQSVLADTPMHSPGERDGFTTDGYLLTAQRLQTGLSISAGSAEQLVSDAAAAATRIPSCANLLRDGLITGPMFTTIVSRTLNVFDPDILTAIDREIATELTRVGAVSRYRVKAVADRIVDSRDADAVRENYRSARKSRYAAVLNADDGMALLHVLAAAEDTRSAFAAIDALIAGVCPNDPRTKNQRRSDAIIARLSGSPFRCGCRDEVACAASLDDTTVSARQARTIVHVICRRDTINGAPTPGFMDGYGTISAEHVRDIAAHPDTRTRDLYLDDILDFAAPDTRAEMTTARITSGTCALPSDSYRPSTTTETIVRFLFGSCSIPGCSKPAYACDLDHVAEYNQLIPAAGGPTCLCNLNPKCRGHHLLKTHGNSWLDDQYRDTDGDMITSWATPDGTVRESLALNHWLFPELAHSTCVHVGNNLAAPDTEPGRYRDRTAAKHARRRAERNRQRQRRRTTPEPFVDLGPPPF